LDRETGGFIGTVASIVVAILIAYILIVIGLNGVPNAFQQPALSVMIALLISGLGALYGYIYYAEESYKYMRTLSPLALALAGIGVVSGIYNWLIGGVFIVVAYIIEYIVGYHLAKDFAKDSPIGAKTFLVGGHHLHARSTIHSSIKVYRLYLACRRLRKTLRSHPGTQWRLR
jgi:hypothetical protein